GAVLEVPAWQVEGDIAGQLASGRYMVASTLHWHPLLNGYTAYPPPTAEFLAAAIRRLPDPDALAVLVDSVDVRWIVVHGARWPALGVRRDGLVGLTYGWTAPSGRTFPEGAFTRLLHDVAPGETVDTTMLVFPGGEPGTWRLEARLVQEGLPEPLARESVPV